MVLFSFQDVLSSLKKGPPERSEGVLLSTVRRDNGICNPSTPLFIKFMGQFHLNLVDYMNQALIDAVSKPE